MRCLLRWTSAAGLWLAFANGIASSHPPDITLLAFEWREPYAFGWIVPDTLPTVTANSLVARLAADAAANTIQEARADASTIFTEGWLWNDEADAAAELVW
jgi:hypothetical protein